LGIAAAQRRARRRGLDGKPHLDVGRAELGAGEPFALPSSPFDET